MKRVKKMEPDFPCSIKWRDKRQRAQTETQKKVHLEVPYRVHSIRMEWWWSLAKHWKKLLRLQSASGNVQTQLDRGLSNLLMVNLRGLQRCPKPLILQHAINLRKLFEMDFYPEPGSNLIQVKVTKPGEKTPAHLFVSFYQQYSNFPSIPSKN